MDQLNGLMMIGSNKWINDRWIKRTDKLNELMVDGLTQWINGE